MYQYDWDSYGFPMDKDSIGKTELVDVNFDGIKDVLIYKGAFGNQGIQYFDCYLWNKQKRNIHLFLLFQYRKPSTRQKA